MLLRSSIVAGIALVRTVYWVSPIFAVPDGKVRFWALTAFDHIERGQALGQQLGRVEIDHDLAILAASRRRQGDAVDRRQLLAETVDAVIVELLLVERVGAQADLQHRHAGGVVLHDDRRLDARRHQHADVIRRRDDLRDRQIEIDVGLKIDLLDRDAVERLRLDVLDPVDAGADRIFAVGGDALLHLRRAEPGVLPDHRDDRDLDLRKNVGRHRQDRGDAEKQDESGKHIKGVRQPAARNERSHASPSSQTQDG